ncbi:hypothetical protein HPP92_027184 [Vanilla planifolia]|uniref:riboflavin kinase n=1 Tax=Vanilla planifolia TaxID=51239 RepID=A0A835U5Y0_VANPL|nr:hypothetical protein HPP92_027184 [Vanilla planifolia]
MVSHVILDLDGTLLNTDGIVIEVLKVFLGQYGKKWDSKQAHRIVGKTPLEAAAAIVEDYNLPCTIEDFMSTTTPMFSDQQPLTSDLYLLSYLLISAVHSSFYIPETTLIFGHEGGVISKALPGANRLIKHLRSKGVPFGLASNSPISNIEAKILFHKGWKESFCTIVGGNGAKGKPSPDVFLEAARRMKVNPSNCLVIEDSFSREKGFVECLLGEGPGSYAFGCRFFLKECSNSLKEKLALEVKYLFAQLMQAWCYGWQKAAGMVVVVKPSLPKQADVFNSADEVINSLLDLHLEKWGLPPFEDWVEDTLPIEPFVHWRTCYKRVLVVVQRYLAYLQLIYLLRIFPVCCRSIHLVFILVGLRSPHAEPWLLHEFEDDFYGEELRLVVVGYIRPEANFPSLESLIQRIQEDGKIAEKALQLPIYSGYKDDPYLKNSASDHL